MKTKIEQTVVKSGSVTYKGTKYEVELLSYCGKHWRSATVVVKNSPIGQIAIGSVSKGYGPRPKFAHVKGETRCFRKGSEAVGHVVASAVNSNWR